MCYTGVILNPNCKCIDYMVVWKLLYRMRYNPHGFYLYSTQPYTYLRTTSIEVAREALENLMRHVPRNLHFHFRLASSGLVDDNNVHGWKTVDYYVTHNGFVAQYAMSELLSDTHLLVIDSEFNEYLRQADWEKLYDYLLDVGFYGIMFLVKGKFEDIIAISVSKYMHYYDIDGVVYATSGPLVKMKHKKYRDGVFRITYDGVETIVSKPYEAEKRMMLKYFEQDNSIDTHNWWDNEVPYPIHFPDED